jgi:predicted kinase
MAYELRVLIGLPGSGKSTWAKQEADRLTKQGYSALVISRDEIRFSMLQDNDDYFVHENEVFNKYIETINKALSDDNIDYVFADATHLSYASRVKLIRNLEVAPNNLVFEYITCGIATCKAHNAKRTGRERVPGRVIDSMAKSITAPSQEELYEYCRYYDMQNTMVNYHHMEEE